VKLGELAAEAARLPPTALTVQAPPLTRLFNFTNVRKGKLRWAVAPPRQSQRR